MAIKQVSSITFNKHVLPASLLVANPDMKVQEMLLGRIMGIVRGIRVVKDPTGENITATPLKGEFRAIPADTSKKEITESSVCYLPAVIMADYMKNYGERDGNTWTEFPEDKQPSGPLKLAFDIYAKRADNAEKFTYRAVGLCDTGPVEKSDPFALIEAEILKAQAPKARK